MFCASQALGVDTEDDVQLLVNYFVALSESAENSSASMSRKAPQPPGSSSENTRARSIAEATTVNEVHASDIYELLFSVHWLITSSLPPPTKTHNEKSARSVHI